MVRKAHRLRHLQMGKAGHHCFSMLFGNRQQSALQFRQQTDDQIYFATQPQTHISSDLVVAAASSMQTFASVTCQLGQAGFDIEVYVFQRQLPFKITVFNLGPNLRHAFGYRTMVFFGNNALMAQHLGVRQTGGDVGLPQTFVKENAGCVALNQFAHGFRKQRRPRLGFFVELVL